MKLKQLFTDDEAVSPVIGVILMVAITVILAAVIGTFVLGLGNQVQSTTPAANFAVDYSDNGDAAANPNTNALDVLTITHDGGDKIPASQLSLSIQDAVLVDDTTVGTGGVTDISAAINQNHPFDGNFSASGAITAGDSITVAHDSSFLSSWTLTNAEDDELTLSKATIRVLWTSESGDNSATLRKWSGPDA